MNNKKPDGVTPGDVVRLEGFDLPPNARFHYFYNGDARLRAMISAPEQGSDPKREPRGSIIFSPGRTEFIEKYFEMTKDLVKRGFVVLIVDPRGQGLSQRLAGTPMTSYVADFEQYCEDFALAAKVFESDLPRPHIVMGHSMGGTIGLQSILTGRLNPAACVFSAPMLELYDLDKVVMTHLIKLLSFIGLAKRDLPFQAQRGGQPLPFKSNKLTSDPDRYKLWATYFQNHKNMRVGPPTYGWIRAALRAMKFVNANAAHLKIPALIIAAGADPIVTPSSIENFAKEAGADFLNISGALHEILIERDELRDQFWTAFDAFLEKNAL